MSHATAAVTTAFIQHVVLPHYVTEEQQCQTQIQPLGNGHINGTWRVITPQITFVLQRINTTVFPQPWALINNAVVIAKHLSMAKTAYPLAVTQPLATLSGDFAIDLGAQGFWRTMSYIANSCSVEQLSSVQQATQLAQAFGQFVAALADLNPDSLQEVIPAFRSLPARLHTLQQVAETDRLQRLDGCRQWYDFAFSQQALLTELAEIEPLLPRRICHNDTKINNLLFAQTQPCPIAVVDLDTCMPGPLMYDFGDMVRSCCAAVAEDATELQRVRMMPDYFAALVAGWQQALGTTMTSLERQSLWLGTRVVTLMLAVRFLTDYLDGDRYFRITHPQHNLERAANQLTLYQQLLAQQSVLKDVLDK
ncbi:aminoglycoside phosphotransferase family protein [Shewanella sp. 4t3-1-2LB]|uniref:phosphotransferase enzyme family protein n=1 Tax=Shewanella sp. 4t3-1-2LB TaxID=2817682 RepID=UPI001F61F1ED|nr:aminoglycoside phosphotransferase family protein [Shewanella sp. 4t3-1-2LB]